MSTQSIRKETKEQLINDIDKSLVCIGNAEVLKERFGVSNKLNNTDVFLLLHYKNILLEPTCEEINIQEGFKKIKKITLKYT